MPELYGHQFPEGLYYHKEYTWARPENGQAWVGLTDLFQYLAGDITNIELPEIGAAVRQGEPCGRVQSAKWIGYVYSPVTGKVVAVNEALRQDPALINESPYDKAWICAIELSAWDNDAAGVMSKSAELEQWVRDELAKLEEEGGVERGQ